MADKFDVADALGDASKRLDYSQTELARAQAQYDECEQDLHRRKRTLDQCKRRVYLDQIVIDALLDVVPDQADKVEVNWKDPGE